MYFILRHIRQFLYDGVAVIKYNIYAFSEQCRREWFLRKNSFCRQDGLQDLEQYGITA